MRAMMFILLSCLVSCGVMRDMRTADRSRLNSPVMDQDIFSDLSTVSPLTGLRSSGVQAGGGCSSCAH